MPTITVNSPSQNEIKDSNDMKMKKLKTVGSSKSKMNKTGDTSGLFKTGELTYLEKTDEENLSLTPNAQDY